MHSIIVFSNQRKEKLNIYKYRLKDDEKKEIRKRKEIATTKSVHNKEPENYIYIFFKV